MAGYSGFATCKELKLSGNKGCMLSLQKMIKVLVRVRLCVGQFDCGRDMHCGFRMV